MDIGPDGSLCRITSTLKDYVNNIQIVKLSEEELLKSNGPAYKLVLIGEETNDSESEKSDEEIFEAENPKDRINELKIENIEEGKVVKVQETVKDVEPNKEKCTKKQFKERVRPKHRQQNHKNYNSTGTRNFKSARNATKTYNKPVSTNDIEPWLNPFGFYSQYPHVMVETLINPSLASSGDKLPGLLGDSPYSPYLPHQNFQSSNQNNHYGHGQNYWNKEYSNNYQTIHDTSVSSQRINKKGYPQNKCWKNHRPKSSWKRNSNESQKEGRKNNRYFNTENRRFL